MHHRTAAIALAVLVLVVSLGVVPSQQTLVVEDAATGERYLTTSVDNGTKVALEYTHSVEKTRVLDGYTVRDDRLEMTRMEFESYGWGLPASANVTEINGTFVFDPDRNATELTVKPGSIAGHRLHVGEQTYDLVAMSDARSVRIYLTHRTTLATVLDGDSNL